MQPGVIRRAWRRPIALATPNKLAAVAGTPIRGRCGADAIAVEGCATVVFAKAPVAGQVKTRLTPALSPAQAARLYSCMLHHCVATVCAATKASVFVYAAPDTTHPIFAQLASRYGVSLAVQRGDDLGQRMLHAIRQVLRRAPACILVGSDCPTLSVADLQQAAAALTSGADVVLGPTADGGYALIGVRQAHAGLFQSMPWSTSRVASLTLSAAASMALKVHTLRPQRDIDDARDIALLPRTWRVPPVPTRQIFDL